MRTDGSGQHDDVRLLILLAFAGYLFLGTLATLFPSIIPQVLRGFRLDLATAGLLFPANAIGALLGSLAAGAGSDRLGRKPFLFASGLLSCICLLGAGKAPNWAIFLLCFLLLGAAQGALGNTLNALILDLHPEEPRRALSRLHGLHSVGAMLSPFLVGRVLQTTGDWRPALLGASAVWGVLGLAALLGRYPQPERRERGFQAIELALLRNGVFGALFCVGFLYNGVAWALLGWIKEHLTRLGAAAGFATSMISLFYGGLALGRFAASAISERVGDGRMLLFCGTGSLLTYAVATFGTRFETIAVGVFLSGLTQAGLFPTAIACATKQLPGRAGTVTGTLSVGMMLGGALPPLWTGALGELWGLSAALRFNCLLVLPLIGIGVYVQRHTPPAKQEGPDEES